MNQENSKLRYVIILVIFLIPVLGVLLFAGNFVRDNIVVPLEYDFWLAKIAINAIPQYIFWGILIAIGLIIAVYSLEANRGPSQHGEDDKGSSQMTRGQRVLFWVIQIRSMRRGFFSEIRFSEFYSKLIVDILTYTGQIDPQRLDHDIEKGSLDLPEPILTFLKLKYTRFYELPQRNIFIRIRKTLHQWLNPSKEQDQSKKLSSSSMDTALLQSIAYLEKKLEVRSNHYGNQ